jgi:hypothetical protein
LKKKNKIGNTGRYPFSSLAQPSRTRGPVAHVLTCSRSTRAPAHSLVHSLAKSGRPSSRSPFLSLTRRPRLSSPSSRRPMAIKGRRPPSRRSRAPSETELHQHHHPDPTNLVLRSIPQQSPRREPHPRLWRHGDHDTRSSGDISR